MSYPDVWGPSSYKDLMAFSDLLSIGAKILVKNVFIIVSKGKLFVQLDNFINFRGYTASEWLVLMYMDLSVINA